MNATPESPPDRPRYVVVTDHYLPELQASVEARLAQGWQLAGDLVVVPFLAGGPPGMYLQPMTMTGKLSGPLERTRVALADILSRLQSGPAAELMKEDANLTPFDYIAAGQEELRAIRDELQALAIRIGPV